ncbi:putative oxidoreductase MhqP [Mycobacterium marinum]|uniref:DoxX family protein n=1 Tax=Mycobacterium marinum TaxID=1781 RepID=UPI000358EF00|nr:DoxX family protein [Mycobacterium marinum]AXN43665.1 Putative oxidoreductase MhqP [Mycobacterium marinum]AXN49033.1 Putative oxidoreductase MhqP [Mycobacterium marinum]EPQ79315.1 quinone oxidoreductase [Mycobacterium marinum str. Europe]RFZ02124.1 putative oxidoreductase MhqP [Mycobacterium marinum]RFZ10590.1 putative oxidoreductase MhqP [Mycobacterium marinum]
MTSSNDSRWQRPDDSPGPIPGRPVTASLVDPEDDLTPAKYSSDFGSAGTTTVIPPYDPTNSGAVPSGYNLMDAQEPLPYVQPQPGARHIPATPAALDMDEDDERIRAASRRGTQNFGLLILRVGLGAVLIAHGLQKLFGWWGGSGVTAFKNSLSDVGFQHADILAYVGAGGEIVVGVLLVLGLFTPLAGAGALAFLINGTLANVSARPYSQFSYFLPDGHEYQITLVVMAVAVILSGPGRYGLDAGRGWAHRPFIGSFVALLTGIAAGIAIWVLLNGVNPVA